ncbi:MAG: tryptophanase [Promethearchaeota archaeon]
MSKEKILPEPFKIKMVEPIRLLSKEERQKAIEEAGYNTFVLRSKEVFIDLLTDSGTNTMSSHQWAAIMLADEAYGGRESCFKFKEAVQDIMGYKYVVLTNQGRAAEHILYGKALVKPGDFVPRNMFFTTSKFHIEAAGGTLVEVIIDEAYDPQNRHPFKGNVDLKKLEDLINRVGADKVPFINIETNVNMAGGQPISMENLKKVREFADKYDKMIVLDICRGMENAFLIKEREPGYSNKSCAEILLEICSYSDCCMMSAKKDAIVNMGGFIGLNDPELFEKLENLGIEFIGSKDYGGMSGRDMEAVAVGLREGIQDDYLASRIRQVRFLGEMLLKAGVPIVEPIGGHAVYLDAKRFLPHIPRDQFPAQTLAAAIYLHSGVRSMERGGVSAGRDKETGENIFPHLELVRLTIPRRVYTNDHMRYVAESIIELFEDRDKIKGLKMVYEPKHLRFFKGRFEPVK